MKKFINIYGRNLLIIITLALVFIGFNDYFVQFAEKDKSQALFFIIAPIVLHFAWNSPLEGDWVTPLFGSINLSLTYYVFTFVDSLDEGIK
ncbi:MAG: hypothetical protein PT956_00570 [Firmicutes bacterium]|nr:hypothetical protein [Bacillota bacterium]